MKNDKVTIKHFWLEWTLWILSIILMMVLVVWLIFKYEERGAIFYIFLVFAGILILGAIWKFLCAFNFRIIMLNDEQFQYTNPLAMSSTLFYSDIYDIENKRTCRKIHIKTSQGQKITIRFNFLTKNALILAKKLQNYFPEKFPDYDKLGI